MEKKAWGDSRVPEKIPLKKVPGDGRVPEKAPYRGGGGGGFCGFDAKMELDIVRSNSTKAPALLAFPFCFPCFRDPVRHLSLLIHR